MRNGLFVIDPRFFGYSINSTTNIRFDKTKLAVYNHIEVR